MCKARPRGPIRDISRPPRRHIKAVYPPATTMRRGPESMRHMMLVHPRRSNAVHQRTGTREDGSERFAIV